MDFHKDFDFFTEQLLNAATNSFKETEESKLLEEKRRQMHRDCETMLMEDQQEFVMECFELLSDIDNRHKYYLYQRGLRDGIRILVALECST